MSVTLSPLYYESHITVEPVYGERLDRLIVFVGTWNFKVADLLMKKRLADTPERSVYDTFCTSKSHDLEDLVDATEALVGQLKLNGYDVWRWKIEAALEDHYLRSDDG